LANALWSSATFPSSKSGREAMANSSIGEAVCSSTWRNALDVKLGWFCVWANVDTWLRGNFFPHSSTVVVGKAAVSRCMRESNFSPAFSR
jgi:hypothetical protein